MQREDEPTPYDKVWNPPEELNDLARRVIGAAIEVHEELGPGLPEEAYQRAMELELTARGIQFLFQHPVEIFYKGTLVCKGRLDFLIENQLVVEIKSIDSLAPIHTRQVPVYLHQTQLHLGLLINFNVPILKDGLRRVIRS